MQALLLQSDSGADHFRGVGDHLRALGIEPITALPEDTPPTLPSGVRVVALADTLRLESIGAIRAARARSVPTLLLMDGIVEWRNTHENPSVDRAFLRPAPVDLIACAGWVDRATLRSLGNDARATGLPRLATDRPRHPLGDRLLIATARRAAFNEQEHARLRCALEAVRDATDRLAIPADWRISPRLAHELGVERDTKTLESSLQSARGVLTSVSTLMIEAMGAGRPTGLIHPHPTPLLHNALATWGASDERSAPDPAPFIERILGASPADVRAQDRLLATIHRRADPSPRVARLIASLARSAPRTAARPMPRFARPLQTNSPGRAGGLVRLCVIDGAAASHESDARARAIRSSAQAGARTLVILTDPRADGLTEHDRAAGPTHDVLVLDPTEDHTLRLANVLEAVERLAPDRLDGGETDLGRSIEAMYSAARGRPPARPGDALRLWSPRRWNKAWADDPDCARRWIISTLERCGARRIASERNQTSSDVVVFEGLYTPEMHSKVLAARRAGPGAVVAPALTPPLWSVGAIHLGAMVRAGARRLAIYGGGAHTKRLARLFELDLPIVAVLDDTPAIPMLHGRPVLTPDEGVARLGIDGVLISSDAHEGALWRKTLALRGAGMPVRTIYGACATRWIDTYSQGEIRHTA